MIACPGRSMPEAVVLVTSPEGVSQPMEIPSVRGDHGLLPTARLRLLRPPPLGMRGDTNNHPYPGAVTMQRTDPSRRLPGRDGGALGALAVSSASDPLKSSPPELSSRCYYLLTQGFVNRVSGRSSWVSGARESPEAHLVRRLPAASTP